MNVLKAKPKTSKIAEELQSMKAGLSIKFDKERIDRDGKAWKKTGFWLRKDYLNKIKVIAHFEASSTEEIVNKALGEYVAREFDKSRVLKKIVTKSVSSSQKIKI